MINATGRRKDAVARIFMKKGSGKITINDRDYKEFFSVIHLEGKVREPLVLLGLENDYDIQVNVNGGGVKGQAEAVRHGIARALVKVNEEYKKPLKDAGYITRDPRVVERKKPGLRKARKKEQYSKR